jgi:hypothetical protein
LSKDIQSVRCVHHSVTLFVSGRICDICEAQHLTNEAEIWCPQCEEALCSKCKVHHEIARITKTHETVPIEDYSKLPESVQI